MKFMVTDGLTVLRLHRPDLLALVSLDSYTIQVHAVLREPSINIVKRKDFHAGNNLLTHRAICWPH